LRFSRALQRRNINLKEIGLFQEVHLGNARAVREIINSGERTFSDFMPILRKAAKFKDWLSTKSPDANLLEEFYQAATSETWINKLPGKTLRYVVTSTVGLAGLVPGLAASAIDEFLVDRLLGGWKPNRFVDGPLKKFTSEN